MFLILTIGCFFLHILSDDCKVLCAVLFSVNIILRTTLEISVR